jgi:hypothetical protein
VFNLEPGQEVACFFCLENGNHRGYTFGEAFLAGADHTPYDGNANYVCKTHLDDDAVIVGTDPTAEPGTAATASAAPLAEESR